MAQTFISHLRDACDGAGNLPDHRRSEVGSLVAMLEARLQ
jgi:hypothetical protein